MEVLSDDDLRNIILMISDLRSISYLLRTCLRFHKLYNSISNRYLSGVILYSNLNGILLGVERFIYENPRIFSILCLEDNTILMIRICETYNWDLFDKIIPHESEEAMSLRTYIMKCPKPGNKYIGYNTTSKNRKLLTQYRDFIKNKRFDEQSLVFKERYITVGSYSKLRYGGAGDAWSNLGWLIKCDEAHLSSIIILCKHNGYDMSDIFKRYLNDTKSCRSVGGIATFLRSGMSIGIAILIIKSEGLEEEDMRILEKKIISTASVMDIAELLFDAYDLSIKQEKIRYELDKLERKKRKNRGGMEYSNLLDDLNISSIITRTSNVVFDLR